jgi:hypothetical protein
MTEKYVKVINNFLPEKIYDIYNEYSKKILKENKNICTTNYTWENELNQDSSPVLVHIVDNKEIITSFSDIIKKKLNRDINNMMFYYWTPCSNIPWHDDSGSNGGITIYLNETWNRNCGGLFLYEDITTIYGIYPEKNKLIEQYGNVYHSVSPTTMRSDIRRTIQAFY